MPSAISRKQQQASSGGRICGAKKKGDEGGVCSKPAGWGTEHPGFGNCKYHTGTTPAGNTTAQRQRVTYEAKALLGLELVEDPHRVLLRMVYYANAMTQWLAGQVAALEHQQREMDELTEGGLSPQAIESFYTERTKLGRIMHVYITAFAEERDRAARTAKMAIDAGVAERLVQVEEAKAMLLARTIQTVLDDLDLNESQRRKAPAVVRARLMELEAAGTGAEAEVEFARRPKIANLPVRPDPVDPDRPYVETMGASRDRTRKKKRAAKRAAATEEGVDE